MRLPKLAIFTNPKSPQIWHVQHLLHIKSPRKLRNIQFMRRERISHDMRNQFCYSILLSDFKLISRNEMRDGITCTDGHLNYIPPTPLSLSQVIYVSWQIMHIYIQHVTLCDNPRLHAMEKRRKSRRVVYMLP